MQRAAHIMRLQFGYSADKSVAGCADCLLLRTQLQQPCSRPTFIEHVVLYTLCRHCYKPNLACAYLATLGSESVAARSSGN